MILIDPPTQYVISDRSTLRWGDRWSHLTCTGDLEELHAFAARLDIPRRYFQDRAIPHYDVMSRKYQRAIELGAQLVTRRDLVMISRKRTRDRQGLET